MYIPNHFRVDDPATLHAFIHEHPFATIVSVTAHEGNVGVPVATHIPLYLETKQGALGTIFGHLARSNPQWHSFGVDTSVLAIFSGPHAYVSPSWYENPNVPTWNYTAVHAYGQARIVDDPQRIRAILKRSIDAQEAHFTHPWSIDRLAPEYVARMVEGIVAFEFEITRLEGAYKLSQNRSPRDQKNVADELTRSVDPSAKATGQLMHTLKKPL